MIVEILFVFAVIASHVQATEIVEADIKHAVSDEILSSCPGIFHDKRQSLLKTTREICIDEFRNSTTKNYGVDTANELVCAYFCSGLCLGYVSIALKDSFL